MSSTTAVTAMAAEHAFPSPARACEALVERLAPVPAERIDLSGAAGRILAEPLLADRPSPPADVSAMDGYALRLDDLAAGRLSVRGEVAMGQRPPDLPSGSPAAVRIVTGGGIPQGADTVIRREDVTEHGDHITVDPALADRITPGANIRRAGENLAAGSTVVPAGTRITPPVAGALATFGAARPAVRRRVRAALLLTGDELLAVDAEPTPWQIRDSNGHVLAAMLGGQPWIDVVHRQHCPDTREALDAALASALERADAVILTGGVSMGDKDHVPAAVRAAGGEVLFHRLPQRPGKPILGAIGPRGQCILGLPGNPVSVMVTARRIGAPALDAMAGRRAPAPPSVRISDPDDRTIHLWWHRLVRTGRDGDVTLAGSVGSGDLVAAARADGFVEVAPGARATGDLPFYPWAWD